MHQSTNTRTAKDLSPEELAQYRRQRLDQHLQKSER